MALIQWNESLSVGVSRMDEQHQRLIEMINELNAAMLQGKGTEVLSDILDGLADYTKTHFATEERYFDQFGYPSAAEHREQHELFTRKVMEFKGEFDQGRLGLSVKLMQFLSDWLQNHIKGVDKRYGPFFNERGLR